MYHFFKSSLQKDIIIPSTPEVYFLFVCLSLTYDLFTFTQRIYHEHGHIIYNLEKRMVYYNHDFKNIIDISNSIHVSFYRVKQITLVAMSVIDLFYFLLL